MYTCIQLNANIQGPHYKCMVDNFDQVKIVSLWTAFSLPNQINAKNIHIMVPLSIL